MANIEEWRAVPGWEGEYEVSDQGRVRSLDREVSIGGKTHRLKGKILVLSADKDGRPSAGLSRKGQQHRFKVAGLVLRVFVGPRPPGKYVRVLDGDQSNCALSNLCYADVPRGWQPPALPFTQRRLLEEVREHGTVVYNGLYRRAIEALAERGLVWAEVERVPPKGRNYPDLRYRITVHPVDVP